MATVSAGYSICDSLAPEPSTLDRFETVSTDELRGWQRERLIWSLRHAYDMWRGRHLTSDAVRKITFHNLRVAGESTLWMQTDGEPRGSAQQVEINVKSHALKLLVPPRGMKLLKDHQHGAA